MPVESSSLSPAHAATSLREPSNLVIKKAHEAGQADRLAKTLAARTDTFSPAKPREIAAGYENPALTRKTYGSDAQELRLTDPHANASSALRESSSPQSQALSTPIFNQNDLDGLLEAWGTVSGQERFASEYDLDNDGRIGANDLAQLLGNFSAEEPVAEETEEAPPTAADVNELLEAWGTRTGDERFSSRFDLDQDGLVGARDLAELLGRPAAEPAADALPTREERLASLLEGFGARVGEQQFNSAFDFDGDGVISSADLAEFLGRSDEDE